MNEENKPEKAIELKSPAVQEILGRPPRWVIRWGITVIFMIVAGLVVGSYFFKYPDILTATITVTTENLPAGVMAKSTGKIDTLFVAEKQQVKEGDLLAVIENPALLRDILEIKLLLAGYHVADTAIFQPIARNLQLGDIQQSWLSFLKAYEDYQYFIQADYHHKKIAVIEKQIQTQKGILQKSQQQLNLGKQQLVIAHQIFAMDSALYAKKALSGAEYQNAKNSYLQQQQSFEGAKLGIDNQNMGILQSEQTVFDLEQQRNEQLNQLQIALNGAFDQLQTQIKNWEQTYLLVSPCSGMVTFTKYWQKNQNINAGEVLVTIVPGGQAKITGKILLPPQGAGKVKEGQMVNVKFDNFPHMEFGMVRVQIKNISLVPVVVGEDKKAYMLEVDFPDKLKTNYGKELAFSQEMTGTAEIITEDLRLLDKFINPIKAIIKK
jgi:HlyD family secretion protein